MARVIQGGTSTHVEVAFCGEHLMIWKMPNSYMVFYGDQSLEVTEPEAGELAQDLESLAASALESKWQAMIEAVLGSL